MERRNSSRIGRRPLAHIYGDPVYTATTGLEARPQKGQIDFFIRVVGKLGNIIVNRFFDIESLKRVKPKKNFKYT